MSDTAVSSSSQIQVVAVPIRNANIRNKSYLQLQLKINGGFQILNGSLFVIFIVVNVILIDHHYPGLRQEQEQGLVTKGLNQEIIFSKVAFGFKICTGITVSVKWIIIWYAVHMLASTVRRSDVMNQVSDLLHSWVLFGGGGGSTRGTVLLDRVWGLSKLYESCSEDELILKTTTRFSFRQCW